jgi:Protein of unknown function (DUF2786)
MRSSRRPSRRIAHAGDYPAQAPGVSFAGNTGDGPLSEERPISTSFTENERQRFRNLLELANSSPYQGERDNAMAAAERLAGRHGMTLEEAARGGTQSPRPEPPPHRGPEMWQERELARVVHLMDYQIQLDKARIAEAMKEAIARGLEPDPVPQPIRPQYLGGWRPFRSRRRMEPYRHAQVLLEETSLPIEEIADITGLDVYKVASLKLKIRQGRSAG